MGKKWHFRPKKEDKTMKNEQVCKISPKNHPFLANLEHIKPKPSMLYFRGKLPEFGQNDNSSGKKPPVIAIVGSRRPTRYGQEVAYRLAYDLAKTGAIIVSGLALGLDAAGHNGCLDAGGTTVAVLASGIDTITPHSNQKLGERIIGSGGAIISEYRHGEPAYASRFLERNRVVSGLSDAVIIVEAAERSGTLSTAAHALNQGKTVFAVPGPITSPLSAGCNNLLKQGATPALSASDILQTLLGYKPNQIKLDLDQNPDTTSTQTQAKILSLIKSGLRDGDQIAEQLHLSPATFAETITFLEIDGHVRALGANLWTTT